MKFTLFPSGIKKHINGEFYRLGKNPAVDWVMALIIFLVLCVLGVFLTIINKPSLESVSDSENNTSKTFSAELLNQILVRYEEKDREFKSLLSEPPSLADPSK